GGEKFGSPKTDVGYRLMEKYGPTEATVSVTYSDVLGREYPESVGSPVSNTSVYILDHEHRRVPVGAVGELFLSGYQLSSGYLNNPERNSQAFFDNPFSSKEGYGRMYATGDFFRMLPDGTLGYIGRRDGQVKIRGNRVELTEVEACVRSFPGISNVTVQPVVVGNGAKELCAYVVSDSQVSVADVQSFVFERKPDYMVPAFVVQLDSIPLNVNGKVDRRALPKPDLASLRAAYAAPRNETERIICDAFAEALGVEKVGIDDDFIRLGGDSLKAVKVVSVCRSSGVEAKASDILSRRTPRNVASSMKGGPVECIYTLETGCPLVGGSLDVYLDMESGKSSSVYVIDVAYPMPEGTSDEDAVTAVRRLLEVHPVLKSRIVLKDGAPWISVDAEPEVTVSDAPARDIRRPFVLNGGLSRFNVVSGKCVQAAFHHTVSDGLTAGIVGRSLDAIFAGRPPEQDLGFLKDASLYASADLDSAEGFFESMLTDVSDASVPVPDPDGRYGADSLDLSVSLEEMSEAARRMGSTPANLLAAAFGYMLSRFTGSGTSVFSHIVNGRDLTSSEGSAGMFVRTLPVAIDCRDRAVSEFVSESSDVILGTVANQLCPFQRLARDFGLGFGIVFNYLTGREQHGDAFRPEMKEEDLVGNLSFNLIRSEGGYTLSYYHSSDYSPSTVSRMAYAFDRIVSGLASCERLSDIRYTSDEDVSFLEGINDTSAPLRYGDVLEVFRRQASVSPDSVLLTYLDSSYTYAEVDRISDSIASALSSQGVRLGDRVAVMVPRSEWYMLCALGVMKTGAAYVPVDVSYPDERASLMLHDSSVKAILVTEETSGRASALVQALKPSPCVVSCAGLPASKFDPVAVSPQDAALVLYTSGTTGRPKGSLITHLALENLSEWTATYSRFDKDSVFGLFASIAFDMHTLSFYPPLMVGGRVDIVPEDVRLDLRALNEHFKSHGVTHTFITTNLGKMFASSVGESTVRFLAYGGEKLGEFSAPEFIGAVETYGPSENLAISAAIPVNDRSHSSSVGRLISNVKGYVLDAEHRRVPVGAVGELFLSGYQLSSGYLNNPERNAEAFFPNPFSSEKGHERMYATGDFFRVLPDGTLGVIGRRDGQVKVRGNRVELTEVEACIRSFPGISNVTVQPIATENGTKELCAYVVSDSQVSATDVQSFVSERKPDYMVPAFVVQMDSIPVNFNGKVDRRALPKPDLSSLRVEYSAPRSEPERILCDVFAQALGVERVGIDDDFIRLGGDSLKAVKAVSLGIESGIGIKARDIISLRTVRALSPKVSSAADMGSSVGDIGATPLQSLFLSSGTEAERDSFVQSMDLECLAPISVGVLQRSIDILTDRHDILRAVYDDDPRIREQGESVCSVREIDAPSEDVILSATKEALGTLSLREGRLMACLLILFKGKRYIRLIINHMAVDGVSWNIILSDLSECISAVTKGKDPVLPPRTMPVRDWIARGYTPSASEKAYWEKASRLVSPFDRTGEAVPFLFRLSAFSLSNPYGLEASDVLLAAFAAAYKSVTGKDPVLRMEGHGRDADAGRTVGWFTCLYPLALHTSGDPLRDAFAVRSARRSVPKGGRGYGYLHSGMPAVTFNYLSSAFSYSDGLLVGTRLPMPPVTGPDMGEAASFNILEAEGGFIVSGFRDPSLDLEAELQRSLDSVLEALSTGCRVPLSGSQLNVYLDELANDKGTAYSAPGTFPIPEGASDEDAAEAIRKVVDAHPVLSMRIEDVDGEPWMVPGRAPDIETGALEGFIRPFDLSDSLCRFRIAPGYVLWDAHHTIMDA
ncbi:MAG: amino acid adenylation domain-containing protein, partial [Candidatus Methanomethylophilaceae archaeon]|nr:amino acid adenylation domain-containing protein [Candidatus Methanomethylophilaceae archaeon]